MMRLLVLAAAACAFLASSIFPAAALPVPKASRIMDVSGVPLIGDRVHVGIKKKRHRSRPSIQFYYNPWPYYGYRYDPYYDHGYPYGDDFFYDDYNYGHDWVYRPPVRNSHKKHVNWCKKRYSTYNARTDKYIGRYGKKYRCNSPYDGR